MYAGKEIFTIGHSNRSIGEFMELLKMHRFSILVDVRTVPKSRVNPQFNSDALESALKADGIKYIHAEGLGGFRKPSKTSANTYWKNASFRGFADYMQTSGFRESIEGIERIAASNRVVLMCAEALPWRCHRFLISDALSASGFKVMHILGRRTLKMHTLTGGAKIDGEKITYPSGSLRASKQSA